VQEREGLEGLEAQEGKSNNDSTFLWNLHPKKKTKNVGKGQQVLFEGKGLSETPRQRREGKFRRSWRGNQKWAHRAGAKRISLKGGLREKKAV